MKSALVTRALEEEQLLLLGAGRAAIRFRPHLHVRMADIDLLAEKLRRLLTKLAPAGCQEP